MNILITGASGFVGSQIVTDLINAGHHVICCVRNVKYAQKLFPSSQIIFCDFIKDTDKSIWLSRLKNVDVVINTVGIFYHPNEKIIWKTHFETPRALFDACLDSGVKKIIHISALGVDKYDVAYAKSKLAADDHLSKLPIASVTLRPSLIYGRGSYGGTSLFRGLAGLPFVIPVVGKGEQEFQPIYLPDLSKAVINLIEIPSNKNRILNAVSQYKINLKGILTTLRDWLGFPTGMILKVPPFFIKLGTYFGNLIPNSTLNKSGYEMLMQNNTASKETVDEFANLIQFQPRNFSQGVFAEPSTVQDHWHARLYFIKPLLQLSLAFLWIFTAICSAFLFDRNSSFDLLNQMGVNTTWQPILLYSASTLNFILGLGLLFNFQVRKICLLQITLILIYTLIITIKLPYLWLEPFGPIAKNIPLLVSIYILYILENSR